MATPLDFNQPEPSDFKIVPVTQRTTEEKIYNLKEYLSANIAVARAENNLAKVALFQEHLDLVELLVANSRDRI